MMRSSQGLCVTGGARQPVGSTLRLIDVPEPGVITGIYSLRAKGGKLLAHSARTLQDDTGAPGVLRVHLRGHPLRIVA